MQVATSCTSGTPNVALRNSILRSFANSIVRTAASGCAPASVDVAYTDFNPAPILQRARAP